MKASMYPLLLLSVVVMVVVVKNVQGQDYCAAVLDEGNYPVPLDVCIKLEHLELGSTQCTQGPCWESVQNKYDSTTGELTVSTYFDSDDCDGDVEGTETVIALTGADAEGAIDTTRTAANCVVVAHEFRRTARLETHVLIETKLDFEYFVVGYCFKWFDKSDYIGGRFGETIYAKVFDCEHKQTYSFWLYEDSTCTHVYDKIKVENEEVQHFYDPSGGVHWEFDTLTVTCYGAESDED